MAGVLPLVWNVHEVDEEAFGAGERHVLVSRVPCPAATMPPWSQPDEPVQFHLSTPGGIIQPTSRTTPVTFVRSAHPQLHSPTLHIVPVLCIMWLTTTPSPARLFPPIWTRAGVLIHLFLLSPEPLRMHHRNMCAAQKARRLLPAVRTPGVRPRCPPRAVTDHTLV